MATANDSCGHPEPTEFAPVRHRLSSFLKAAMESILLFMIVVSPWAYGAVHPGFEFLLLSGVSILLALWGVRILLEGRLIWQKCPVALCLIALFLLGLWQVTALSPSLLAIVSPSTSRLYNELLPSQAEQLPSGGPEEAVSPTPGSTISLCTNATQKHLIRLMAVLLVFVIVRNNLASPGALRRLSLIALTNGALLSLFAALQFFSSSPSTVYWTHQAQGTPYGPFLCRNHFPYYVNMCIGLGFGLLWARRSTLVRHSRASSALTWGDWLRAPLRLLNDPASLWISVALAVIITSVAFSLSRGGFLALVGAACLCAFLQGSRSDGSFRLGTAVVVLGLAFGLAGWFGLGRIEDRLQTLWTGKGLEESRLPLWSASFGIVRDFPIWGTGYGTYRYVDPLYREDPHFADFTIDHLHNDYLEVLVEAGVFGLALLLVGGACIYRLGLKAYRSAKRRSAGGLALGALFAFTTLAIHSFGDFGVHVPAIALLAVVVCAQLCGLSSFGGASVAGVNPTALHSSKSESAARAGTYNAYRVGGLTSVVGAAACVALALVTVAAGWRALRADNLRLAAAMVKGSTLADTLEKKRAFLETAVQLMPDDIVLRTGLGDACFEQHSEEKERLKEQQIMHAAATSMVCVGGAYSGMGDPLTNLSLWFMNPPGFGLSAPEKQRLAERYLNPALKHYIRARDGCPLLAGPHLVLAVYSKTLAASDPAAVYRDRAQRLAPFDPTFWYFCGAQELRLGDKEGACKSWRRSLDLSDRHLSPILAQGAKTMSVDDFTDRVLPSKPDMLLTAALRLYPADTSTVQREPFLRKAVAVLQTWPTHFTTKELQTKLHIHKLLGQAPEALATYKDLLEREPLQVAWRLEYAQLLHAQGHLPEARMELLRLLAQEPGHAQARQLLFIVNRERARSD